MAFAHGTMINGGLLLGVDADDFELDDSLSIDMVSSLLAKYPSVHLTMFMTSCYSGHWVETATVRGPQMTVLAAAQPDQESFGFEWSLSQRHCGGIFSSATLSELLKEPSELFTDADADTSRQYQQVTTAILAEMVRLCLPVNVGAYGSEPMFTDPEDTEKFWKRTGYELFEYKSNYDKLKRVPASDPHPKTRRGKFNADYIDDSHPDIAAWNERHPDICDPEFPQATAGYGGTKRGLTSRTNIQFLVKQFLASKPWPFEYDQKMLQRSIAKFNKRVMDERALSNFRQVLLYRLHMNERANQYVRALGLQKMPPIEEWEPILATSDLYQTISTWTRTVVKSALFNLPRGPFYRKPALYLCWAVIESGGEHKDLIDATERIHGMNHEGRFSGSPPALTFRRSGRLSRSVSSLRNILSETWSKSKTQNRRRQRLFDVKWNPG